MILKFISSNLDDDDCRATFVYGYANATGQLQVWVQKTKECPVVVDIMSIVLGVIGAIVGTVWNKMSIVTSFGHKHFYQKFVKLYF